MSYIIKNCPYCNLLVLLPKQEFNCKIYRHGILKSNMKQIDPHLNKEACDRLTREGLIYGCGKPFKITHIINEKYKIEKCDYI
jgi:hypothetical protein